MKLSELPQAIRSGQVDSVLEDMMDAIVYRRKVLGHLKFLDFKVGDRAFVASHVRPEYLQGLEVEITEKRNTKVIVRFVNGPIGKFRGGRMIVNPAYLVAHP